MGGREKEGVCERESGGMDVEEVGESSGMER